MEAILFGLFMILLIYFLSVGTFAIMGEGQPYKKKIFKYSDGGRIYYRVKDKVWWFPFIWRKESYYDETYGSITEAKQEIKEFNRKRESHKGDYVKKLSDEDLMMEEL